jgi:hypothetical protein
MKVLRVGTALDTNGQGYRFHKAAERWGDDPSVLQALIVGLYDPADVGGRFREAAAKIGGLSIRSAHSSEAYFQFPRDIHWTRATHLEVQELADQCDVIHLNNSDMAYRKLRMPKIRKPAVLHHHGTLFRNSPAPLLSAAKRFHMLQAVSTIDLQRVAPDILHWLPTAYDLDEMARIREGHKRPDDGMVRVVSFPTNREIKSTDALQAAVRSLQAEGLPVELVLVSGKPWAESLAVKATADIYFDQVGLGYGCNAVEAWGMGIPVIAGADDWTLARMRKEWNTRTLPFHVATETTIADAIRQLVQSPDLRATVAARGAKHAAKYHAEKPALARLAELYGMAIRKMQAAPPPVDVEEFPVTPGTFRTELPRLRIHVSNQTYTFVDGMLTIDNPHMAQRMRRLAYANPRHQISEVLADAG